MRKYILADKSLKTNSEVQSVNAGFIIIENQGSTDIVHYLRNSASNRPSKEVAYVYMYFDNMLNANIDPETVQKLIGKFNEMHDENLFREVQEEEILGLVGIDFRAEGNEDSVRILREVKTDDKTAGNISELIRIISEDFDPKASEGEEVITENEFRFIIHSTEDINPSKGIEEIDLGNYRDWENY